MYSTVQLVEYRSETSRFVHLQSSSSVTANEHSSCHRDELITAILYSSGICNRIIDLWVYECVLEDKLLSEGARGKGGGGCKLASYCGWYCMSNKCDWSRAM